MTRTTKPREGAMTHKEIISNLDNLRSISGASFVDTAYDGRLVYRFMWDACDGKQRAYRKDISPDDPGSAEDAPEMAKNSFDAWLDEHEMALGRAMK
jgi:hypothetical protein